MSADKKLSVILFYLVRFYLPVNSGMTTISASLKKHKLPDFIVIVIIILNLFNHGSQVSTRPLIKSSLWL